MAGVNTELHNKFRNAIKVPLRQDGDGHEEKVEIREDIEQTEKLQAIIDLLVAAGYFRARIKGLLPFDKVVGGMTWCIESCNVDLDVDLLFQENLTIGQKIALTEKIVVVLPKMKCPHIIEPHQIQGLDFIHIFPVIQWLVKRSMEFRQEMSSCVRTYAINQYNKQFQQTDSSVNNMLTNMDLVKDSYRPHRYFRRKNSQADHDIKSSVGITLLEYGQQAQNVSSDKTNDTLLKMENLQENIDSYDNLNEQDLKYLKSHYVALQLEFGDSDPKTSVVRQMSKLQNQKETLAKQNIQIILDKQTLEKHINDISSCLNDIKCKQKEAEETLNDLEQKEVNGTDEMKNLQELVILNDNLTNQEVQFREHCKRELVRLQGMIKQAKTEKTVVINDDKLQKHLVAVSDKIKLIRLNLAKKNRSVASLQRELDEIPNRAELAQYQRRFLELYYQVSAKHKETKQYYTLYNTLYDTKTYMKKELSLLNSISENYPEAMLSAMSKDEFIFQLQKILEGVNQSKLRVHEKLSEEKKKQNHSNGILMALREQQRKYYNAVKQLMIECKKQELLQ